MRRQPTAEQKAKAAERREKFRELAKRVAGMSDDERAALVARCATVVTCEGRALSPVNSILLLSQRAGVSMVGGFWQWKKVGRRVRKGEAGLSLWIPAAGKGGELIPGPTMSDAAAPGETQRRRFIVGTVFDVSQTDPEPAPGTQQDDGADVEAGELAAV